MNRTQIRCLISAGTTREYFDPVRFVSNPSSGKMGYALAKAAVEIGWKVDLVSGPVTLPEPDHTIVYPVVTGDEMLQCISERFPYCDILIMAAAVCDFRPKVFQEQKVKKQSASWTLEFEPVVDILKTISARKTHQIVVGFAAETENVLEYARCKLIEKNLDWIAANTVGFAGTGFESDHNSITLISRTGEQFSFGPDSKTRIATDIIRRLATQLNPPGQ